MVKEVFKMSTYTPLGVRFCYYALKGMKIAFRLFHVDMLGRHGYYVFLLLSNHHQSIVNCLAGFRCVPMPCPIFEDDEDLKDKVAKYVLKVPW